MSLQPLFYPFHCLYAVVFVAEGCETYISFACRTESHSRCADHMSFVKHLFEELPTAHSVGSLHPQVWSVLSAIYLKAEFCQSAVHQLGIVHVVVDGSLDLLFAFGRIDSFGCPLADIACAVELGALPTIPQMVELYSIAFECGGCEFFWNDGIAASYSRESRCLRVAVELDGHLSCSFYLIY